MRCHHFSTIKISNGCDKRNLAQSSRFATLRLYRVLFQLNNFISTPKHQFLSRFVGMITTHHFPRTIKTRQPVYAHKNLSLN